MELADWQWCALYAVVMGLWVFLASLLIDDKVQRDQWQALSMIWPLVLLAFALVIAVGLAIAPFYTAAWLGNKGRVATDTRTATAKDER